MVNFLDITGSNSLKLEYFELSMLGVARFPMEPGRSFQVFAGPSLGFRYKARLKLGLSINGSGQSPASLLYHDVSSNFAGTDIGGVLGAGYEFESGGRLISINVRWIHGFSNVDATEATSSKNSTVLLWWGVGFPVGRHL